MPLQEQLPEQNPEASAVPVGAGLPAKRPALAVEDHLVVRPASAPSMLMVAAAGRD
ncbi:hypothetical protein D3C76_1725280 [compost metagenome]